MGFIYPTMGKCTCYNGSRSNKYRKKNQTNMPFFLLETSLSDFTQAPHSTRPCVFMVICGSWRRVNSLWKCEYWASCITPHILQVISTCTTYDACVFFFFFCIFYPRASARLSVLDYNTSDHSGFQDERLAVKAWYFSAELLTSLVRHGFNFLKAKSFRHHFYCWAEAIWQKDLHSPNSCKYRNFSEC